MGQRPVFPIESVDRQLLDCTTWPGSPAALRSAARYALTQGGKRLRPTLAWHACEAAGGIGEESLPAGAAVEMIHAFSLVHDDLPAIDNDDLRRGQPTLHRHAGEAMAILAGDALLAGAFECLLTMPLSTNFLSRQPAPADAVHAPADAAQRNVALLSLRNQLLTELARASTAMIHGQVWDTLGGLPDGLSCESQLRLIHENKTGALIVASCRMGAWCALGTQPDDHPTIHAISAFGNAIGLMFQIVDDVLDVTQPQDHVGKRTGKDAAAGKATYPGVLGLDASLLAVDRLLDQAILAIQPLGPKAENLIDLARFLAARTK